jgi:hypothetical protein
MIASFPFIASSMDSNARAFCQASGAQDRAAINFFVKGIKRLGLWDDMVCWPLRSAQNAGTGSTAYSLGGLGAYNGTLVNGPTWGADGVAANGIDQTIGTSYTPPSLIDSDMSCCAAFTLSGKNNNSALAGNRSNGFTFAGFWGNNNTSALTWVVTGTQASVANPSVSIGVPAFYHGLSGARASNTQAYSEVGINDNARESNTVNQPTFGGQKAVTLFEDGNGANRFEGTAAWIALFEGAVAKSQSDSIFALYKSTLGQGLALP